KQGDTEIRVISDKDATFRTKYMDAALGSLSFFEEHIGAYPHDQLDVIVIDADVGMEYPGIVTVMENVQTMDEVVAHEIGHQWFYGMVTNDAFHDPMVDEGITQLATTLYLIDAYEGVDYEKMTDYLGNFLEKQRDADGVLPANLS